MRNNGAGSSASSEAKVDVELAWEARAEAERTVEAADFDAGTAVERLLGERLSLTDVVELTGLGSTDRPAGQIGLLVGSSARKQTLPHIIDWLGERNLAARLPTVGDSGHVPRSSDHAPT